jgi:multidrug resistance efflux pump
MGTKDRARVAQLEKELAAAKAENKRLLIERNVSQSIIMSKMAAAGEDTVFFLKNNLLELRRVARLKMGSGKQLLTPEQREACVQQALALAISTRAGAAGLFLPERDPRQLVSPEERAAVEASVD